MQKRIQSVLASIFMPLFTLGTLSILIWIYLPSQASSTATFVVNSLADTNDGICDVTHCSLREAILAANDTLVADIIIFSLPPSSTIVLDGTQLPPITGTLTIDGSTAVNLKISGGNSSRVLTIGPPSPPYPGPNLLPTNIGIRTFVTITNLHIAEGNESLDRGGGIFNGGVLTIMDSTFSDLRSKIGGIYNSQILIITNTTFISNSVISPYGGGAVIFNESNGIVKITNSSFISNSINASYSIGGAGIYNDGGRITIAGSTFLGNSGGAINNNPQGTLSITHSLFHKNSSGGAGAIATTGVTTITNSTFSHNLALRGSGGAIFSEGVLNILSSTFMSNSAKYGGGAIFTHGNLIMTNCTLSGNSANGPGGGINNYETVIIVNSTFSGNSARENWGGGIFNKGFLHMSNTIIANSPSGNDCLNGITIGTNINNLIEDGSCESLLTGDPLLGPLQNNGGPTLTYALRATSPAVDAGHGPTCAAPPVNNLDQRGVVRPFDGNGDGSPQCDIGAYEYDGPPPDTVYLPTLFRN
jgi:CSLREA domain-containing protein